MYFVKVYKLERLEPYKSIRQRAIIGVCSGVYEKFVYTKAKKNNQKRISKKGRNPMAKRKRTKI